MAASEPTGIAAPVPAGIELTGPTMTFQASDGQRWQPPTAWA